jgi:transglutaminase-like putative cysteine protease
MRNIYLSALLVIIALQVGAQDFRYGKVSKKELLEKEHHQDPEVNAAVLFRSEHVYYEYTQSVGFTLITEVQERVKIYNKEGMDYATKQIITYKSGNDEVEVSGIKGETYFLENGKVKSAKLSNKAIFEEEYNKYRNRTKFTMPSVAEGSIIEYKYRLRSPFLISIDDISLQSRIPIDQLDIKVTIPEFMVFKKHFNPKATVYFNLEESSKNTTQHIQNAVNPRFSVKATKIERSKFDYLENIYSISKEDIPALKKEDHVDYLDNYAAKLTWELQHTEFPNSIRENYSQTWDAVVEKIYDHPEFGNELKKTRYFEDEVDNLLTGISLPEAKINAIYEYVKQKVKWNDITGYYTDNGVKDAFKNGSGNVADINLMLVAMLKYAGLNANPILLSTRDNGIPIFPTRKGFNYVVAGVIINDDVVYLDATDKYLEVGMLPHSARNWQGRIIRDNGTSAWIDLMKSPVSEMVNVLNVKLNDQFQFEGKAVELLDGYYAKSHRDEYTVLTNEECVKETEKNKGKIIISDLVVENENNVSEKVKKTYRFSLSEGAETIGNNIYMNPLLFLTTNSNPFKTEDRQFPVFLKYPASLTQTVNLLLPDNVEVASVPENFAVSINEEDGVFKFVVTQSGNFLRIYSELKLNSIVYLPSDYENLKEFYNQMIMKSTEKIVLTKT